MQIQCSLHVCEPHPFCCSCETHVGNNEEMAFNYTEMLVYRTFTCPREGPTKILLVKGTAHRNKKPFGTKIMINTIPILCYIGHLKKKKKKKRKMEKSVF